MANQSWSTYDVGFNAGSGNREDLLDQISMISPSDTPFLATAPRTEAKHVVHDWLTDTLQATSSAGVAEGTDFATSAPSARTRLSNLTQIFRRTVKVSNTQRAVNPAGVDDEYKYQVFKMGREIHRNIEATIFRVSGACAAGSTAAARTMKNLADYISTRKYARHIVPWGEGTTGGATTSTATSLTQGRLDGILQGIYESGGNPDVIFTNAAGKRMISALSGNSNTRFNIPLDDRRLVNTIDIYDSEFGAIEVSLSRWVARSTGNTSAAPDNDVKGALVCLERALNRVAVLRPIKHVPLPPVGDSTRGMVIGEVTLEVLNPSGNARAWGISNLVA